MHTEIQKYKCKTTDYLLTQKQWIISPKAKILKQKNFTNSSIIQPSGNANAALGKRMKIAHLHHQPEKQALESFLQNYRDTPHPATGVFSAVMTFRDDKKTHFPRKSITEEECIKARIRDNGLKQQRTKQINCSKYRKEDDIREGDKVLIRNYMK